MFLLCCMVSFAIPAGEADTPSARNILLEATRKLNSAKTYRMKFREEAAGMQIQNTIVIKKESDGILSSYHEVKYLSHEKRQPPTLVRIVDQNKIYILPEGVKNTAVRLKYEERPEMSSAVNFFYEGGELEMLNETKTCYRIKYTCSQQEEKDMLAALPKDQQAAVFDSLPTIFIYSINKENALLEGLICFTRMGKIVKKIQFDVFELNCSVDDKIFRIPQQYRILTAHNTKDVTKIQNKLMNDIKKGKN